MIIGLEMILWVWFDKDDYLMKTHMGHAEIFNISIEKEREIELHMLPPVNSNWLDISWVLVMVNNFI